MAARKLLVFTIVLASLFLVGCDNSWRIEKANMHYANSQILAVRFIAMARDKGISWGTIRQSVRMVLFWGSGEKVTVVEVRLKRESTPEVKHFRELWGRTAQRGA